MLHTLSISQQMWCAYCSECRILPFREHIDLTFRQKINKQHFLITLPFTSEEITYLCVGAFVLSFSFMRVPFGLPLFVAVFHWQNLHMEEFPSWQMVVRRWRGFLLNTKLIAPKSLTIIKWGWGGRPRSSRRELSIRLIDLAGNPVPFALEVDDKLTACRLTRGKQ